MSVREQIDGYVQRSPVVLFMKGTRTAPQCGFSATVVDLLDDLLEDYDTVDVLSDPVIREGIKEYSDWPTLPQLYVRGKFVGGADIVREMAASGELRALLGATERVIRVPSILVSPRALSELRAAVSEAEAGMALCFSIGRDFEYDLYFREPSDEDLIAEMSDLELRIDRASARRAETVTIDFVETPSGAGFRINSPAEPPKVKSLTAVELSRWLADRAPIALFDVRTPAERQTASIPDAIPFAGIDTLEALDRDKRLVFQCHHGHRSRAAAEHALRMGFRDVWNLEGGIDAWSVTVDSSVPRY